MDTCQNMKEQEGTGCRKLSPSQGGAVDRGSIREALMEKLETELKDLRGFIGQRVEDPQHAADILQETLEIFIRRIGTFDEKRSSLKTFLRVLARSAIGSHFRAERKRIFESFDDELPAHSKSKDEAEEPEDEAEGPTARETLEMLRPFAGFTEREESYIELRLSYPELSIKETALLLQVSVGRLYKIRSDIRKKLLDAMRRKEGYKEG